MVASCEGNRNVSMTSRNRTFLPRKENFEDPYAYPQDSPTVEAMPDRAELLDQLGALHRYGVLTTDEFSAVTARLLSRER